MKPKKDNRGGAGRGQGRHKGEPTTVISERVKVRHADTIKKIIKTAKAELNKQDKKEKS